MNPVNSNPNVSCVLIIGVASLQRSFLSNFHSDLVGGWGVATFQGYMNNCKAISCYLHICLSHLWESNSPRLTRVMLFLLVVVQEELYSNIDLLSLSFDTVTGHQNF